ncbi:hypothetical protein C8Q73DRAFT_691522 [Cubamyces lactineus]|nr:hypothetical protein C8Q73DRAFT_691522 [Cubamyces lactineus]
MMHRASPPDSKFSNALSYQHPRHHNPLTNLQRSVSPKATHQHPRPAAPPTNGPEARPPANVS